LSPVELPLLYFPSFLSLTIFDCDNSGYGRASSSGKKERSAVKRKGRHLEVVWMVLKRVSATMRDDQAVFTNAIRHCSYHSTHIPIGDTAAAATGGLTSHHQHPLRSNPASAPTSTFSCGSAGPFHPLPLPFRRAAPPTADLPANYNSAGQAAVHHFARPAILPPHRMAAYSAQQDEELAHLQELSNKWEPDATVSNGLKLSSGPTSTCAVHPTDSDSFPT
jgi:hypothetical protein